MPSIPSAISDDALFDRLSAALLQATDLEGLVRPLLALLQSITGLESAYFTAIDPARQTQTVLYASNTAHLQTPEGAQADDRTRYANGRWSSIAPSTTPSPRPGATVLRPGHWASKPTPAPRSTLQTARFTARCAPQMAARWSSLQGRCKACNCSPTSLRGRSSANG
ncbi:MAG: hypothetical protein PHO64_04095 [Thiomonas sp.]|nr:hypothetical protein [Thiomonas sp.]